MAEPAMVKVETVVYISLLILFFSAAAGLPYFWHRGYRYGACVQLCYPARFDFDQDVNGGCLCIGSDKVLRIRKAP